MTDKSERKVIDASEVEKLAAKLKSDLEGEKSQPYRMGVHHALKEIDSLLVHTACLAAPVDEPCGKPAASFIPRWGMSFACVLPKGHIGEHQQGGNCFKHGKYVGKNCPQFPDCTNPAPPDDVAAARALCLDEVLEVLADIQHGAAMRAADLMGRDRVSNARSDIVKEIIEALECVGHDPSALERIRLAARLEEVELHLSEWLPGEFGRYNRFSERRIGGLKAALEAATPKGGGK